MYYKKWLILSDNATLALQILQYIYVLFIFLFSYSSIREAETILTKKSCYATCQ